MLVIWKLAESKLQVSLPIWSTWLKGQASLWQEALPTGLLGCPQRWRPVSPSRPPKEGKEEAAVSSLPGLWCHFSIDALQCPLDVRSVLCIVGWHREHSSSPMVLILPENQELKPVGHHLGTGYHYWPKMNQNNHKQSQTTMPKESPQPKTKMTEEGVRHTHLWQGEWQRLLIKGLLCCTCPG